MFNTRRWNLIDDIFVRFLVFPVSAGSSASVKELPHTPDEVWVNTASDSYNQKESVRARDIVQPVGEELSRHLPPKINEEKSRPWVHKHQGHPTSIFGKYLFGKRFEI